LESPPVVGHRSPSSIVSPLGRKAGMASKVAQASPNNLLVDRKTWRDGWPRDVPLSR
jgi:hypothetical protein